MSRLAGEVCRDCYFYEHANEYGGYCHRFPPQLVHEVPDYGDGQSTQYYPFVAPDEWCGEHKRT